MHAVNRMQQINSISSVLCNSQTCIADILTKDSKMSYFKTKNLSVVVAFSKSNNKLPDDEHILYNRGKF